jgi:hypothetical protein
MWIFSAIANAVGRNFIGRPNYLFDLLFNRVKADGGVTEAQQCTINELTDLQNDNLLSSASLVLTPSSYKEGKLYSVIPENGDGDFTFTRATTATRVNSAGLVELVPYNLVERSEEFNNAYWVKSSSSVTANTETAPNGTMTADTVTLSSTTGRIDKVVSLTSNIDYTISVYAKNIDASNSRIGMLCFNNANTICGVFFDIVGSGAINAVSNATGVIESVGNGWYRCSMTFNSQSGATSPTIRIVNNAASGTGWTNGQSIYIWGAQLVEGTNALPYQKTETRLNIPRIDYSLGGCPNILLEPQRTNLLQRSEEFNNAYWNKNGGSISANSSTAPNGKTTADRLTLAATTTTHGLIDFGVSGVAASTYTVSFYVKKGTHRYITIGIYRNTLNNAGAGFDLDTNTVTGTGATGTGYSASGATMTDVGDGWYRCSVVCVSGTTPMTGSCLFLRNTSYTSGAIQESWAASGTETINLWGAQAEVGAYATSYIPTTTASVTRNQDLCSKTGISSLLNPSEGTFFIEAKEFADSTSDTIQISDGTDNNNITIRYINNKIRFETGGGGAIYRVSDIDYNLNEHNKMILSWKSGSIFGFVNGTKYNLTLASGSGNGIPTALNRINFSFWWGGFLFFGNLKQLSIWNTQLTDEQCSILTSDSYPTAAAAYASLGLVSESPSCLTSTTTF